MWRIFFACDFSFEVVVYVRLVVRLSGGLAGWRVGGVMGGGGDGWGCEVRCSFFVGVWWWCPYCVMCYPFLFACLFYSSVYLLVCSPLYRFICSIYLPFLSGLRIFSIHLPLSSSPPVPSSFWLLRCSSVLPVHPAAHPYVHPPAHPPAHNPIPLSRILLCSSLPILKPAVLLYINPAHPDAGGPWLSVPVSNMAIVALFTVCLHSRLHTICSWIYLSITYMKLHSFQTWKLQFASPSPDLILTTTVPRLT